MKFNRRQLRTLANAIDDGIRDRDALIEAYGPFDELKGESRRYVASQIREVKRYRELLSAVLRHLRETKRCPTR